MVAAEPRDRSNGHVPKKDVQAPPADAPDAAPDDTEGGATELRDSMLLGAFVEAPSPAAGEGSGASGDEASSVDTPLRPAAMPGSGADAGRQWYSDEELARWIADGAGRGSGHSSRQRMDWRWLLYMVAVGPFLLVGLVFAAIARVLLPSRVPVWGFRRRMAALRYLLAVGVLAGIVVVAVLLVVNGGLFFRSPVTESGVGQVVVPPAQQQMQAPATTAGASPAAAQAPAVNTTAQPRTDAPTQRQAQAPAATAVVVPPAAAQAPVVETVTRPATEIAVQPAPTAVAETTVATPAVLPTVIPTPAPVAQPAASPVAGEAPAIEWVVVVNSGGTGVFLRPEPVWTARWRAEPGATQREGAYPHHGNIAWREGTLLQLRGPEVTGTGSQPGSSEAWVPVRDPVGREGYLPARYLQRVEAAALAVPTAAPSASDTGQATAQYVVVAGTNGSGVFLRPRPEWAARWPAAAGETKEQGAWEHHGWVAWLEGTQLQVRGPEVTGTGSQPGRSEVWVPVRDPVGREGFVPARYVEPAG